MRFTSRQPPSPGQQTQGIRAHSSARNLPSYSRSFLQKNEPRSNSPFTNSLEADATNPLRFSSVRSFCRLNSRNSSSPLPLPDAIVSMDSLPPELISHILSLTRHATHSEWLARSRFQTVQNLRSFSLVHPSWTRLAQHLLAADIWMDGRRNDRLLQGLGSEVFRGMQTRRLTIFLQIGQLLTSPNLSLWSHVAYLCLSKVKGTDAVEFEQIKHLSNLRTLHLDSARLVVRSTPPRPGASAPPLPRLQRLIFGETVFEGTSEAFGLAFSPQTMPLVESLFFAIRANLQSPGPEMVFVNLFPTIKSLAIQLDSEPGRSALLNDLWTSFPQSTSLVSLSLDVVNPAVASFLLHPSVNLDLGVLNLALYRRAPGTQKSLEVSMLEGIAAIAKGEAGTTVRAREVNLYRAMNLVEELYPELKSTPAQFRDGFLPLVEI